MQMTKLQNLQIKIELQSRFAIVEKTIISLQKVTRVKFLGGDRISCFTSINKFRSFKNPLQRLLEF